MTRPISRLQALMVAIIMLLATVFLNIGTALGQATSTGTVVGVATDATGAVVQDATIVMTDTSTGAKRTTVTNKDGRYVLVNVTPATYNISCTKAGFEVDQINGETVSVGTQTTANFSMTVGSQNTVVEVQASASDLQTINATIGDTVNPLMMQNLPSVARDVTSFATLQPGVTPGGDVAGTVTDQAVYQLDGGNNSSDMDGSMLNYTGAFGGNPTGITSIGAGSSGVMPMPQDSIEEFKVATTGQTADFNNSSGMQTQVITKRGTSHWHGTVYEYYLDSNIGANTWQNNFNIPGVANYQAKASNHYSRFGAAAGGPVLPSFLGGKTYLFANYEGWRFPNSATYERAVPSANMRNGIVTFSGTNYNLKTLDPRGKGISPVVAQMWNTQEPVGNDTGCSGISGPECDGVNTIGYHANVALPQKSDFGVARLDHDFGSKWHFNTSYRYFKLTKATNNQVDIGGAIGSDKLGVPAALANRPQDPWYYVAGLTTNISSTFTNDFHYSYLRNVWSWNDANAPAQISGLGGALEPFGEQVTTKVLSPYNVDTQNIRTRFWDGHDHFIRDDLTKLKGNHLVQFGGQYQHNYNYHQRTDNGGGINFTPTYQLGDTSGGGLVNFSGLAAAGVPTSSTTNTRILAATLGIVTDSQVAYTRTGNSLSLNPPLTPAQDQATIPYYNLYASDTWHIKPTLTINYGLGWALEMPPVEKTGKQVALVDAADEPIKTADYLAARKSAAVNGQVYNPQVGFALVGNVGSGLKYPYNPFYASFSPRLSAAWNPHFTNDTFMARIFGTDATVIRGGYGRVYGRLNGVGLVLTPLLGPGLIQAVQCRTANMNGTCASTNPTDSTAFRIGVDGTSAPLAAATPTLPQPLYTGYNGSATAAASALDPTFRPNDADSFNLTVQRQINRKMLVEAGYIGRIIHHEFEPININTVPYMMSLGGQSFASAYAAIETAFGCATSAGLCSVKTSNATSHKIYPAVSPQAFFETALAGTGYCTGYANCTTAVVQKEASNLGQQKVFSLWSDLDNGGFNFARTMMGTPIPGQPQGANGQIGSGVSLSTATGYGNYNAGFVTFKATDFHGLTLQENFTYSKTLGTNAEAQASSELTPNDAFDLAKSYGVQYFNQKFIFNTFLVYQTPWYKNQSSLLGRVAGGWTLSPIFTAGTGQPITCATNSGAQSFGGADDSNFFDNPEQCVFPNGYHGAYHAYRNVAGGPDPNGIAVGTATKIVGGGPAAINIFPNPAAVYGAVRPAILGIDEKDSGEGPIAGLPYWNMDMSIRKNVKIWESTGLEFSGVMTNILNHNVFANPSLSLASPTSFGVINSQGNTPRQIEVGVRANF